MRRFENKETKILNSDNENKPMFFSDIANITLEQKARKGTTRLEMVKDLELVKKLRDFSGKPEIVLEDSEYERLKTAEASAIWTFNHEDIVAFGEALDKAEKFTAN